VPEFHAVRNKHLNYRNNDEKNLWPQPAGAGAERFFSFLFKETLKPLNET
jgi:hypothetical protein